MTSCFRLTRTFAFFVLSAFAAHLHAAVGDTRVATWKDNRTAVFMLMFDDGWPSHFQVAVPELEKRGMIATFYICPAKGEFKTQSGSWDKVAKSKMVLADHTMTHQGVKDMANADYEIGECAAVIRKLQPGKENRLVSFGMPGVGPGKWNINSTQLKELLEKHHLVSRPTFDGHGAVYHQKTFEEMIALADKAIAKKGVEYLVAHGVERITPDWGYQDMWPLKQTIFLPLLDALKERSDRGDLWITDHISQYQYATERDGATVKTLKVIANGIQLELKSSADPKFYDLPLTLVTEVPAGWRTCNISQGGGTPVAATAKDGVLTFDATPNGPPISIWPVATP
ncbi:MAG TPA: polysaccharide deacetylase family protein [Rariglobus sp.]|nr:polysaccharide deacetylase family protein [Rariglobus sp.]